MEAALNARTRTRYGTEVEQVDLPQVHPDTGRVLGDDVRNAYDRANEAAEKFGVPLVWFRGTDEATEEIASHTGKILEPRYFRRRMNRERVETVEEFKLRIAAIAAIRPVPEDFARLRLPDRP